MTPEERANRIAADWLDEQEAFPGLMEDIAAAIRAAVEEEREACAKIAEMQWVLVGKGREGEVAAIIRNAIRKRGA
jgi:hypothetical protein